MDVGAQSVADAKWSTPSAQEFGGTRSESPQATSAKRLASVETRAATPKAAADSELIEFKVERAIADACNIPTSSIYLGFDAASLTQEAKERLEVVAKCVKVEALADEALVLVGRSDPKNPDAYSDANLERAIRVRKFLIDEGVDSEALAVKARNDVDDAINDRPYDKARRVTLQRNSDV
tara:strand:- start:54221 stop:54760 length:540 start_codon:yes stop_codon:yes gene_type:complete